MLTDAVDNTINVVDRFTYKPTYYLPLVYCLLSNDDGSDEFK